ncbi:MAG: class I SAM-dependent methyltransferase [Actinobacteria bacterium]|nr:class I SAM-dependent methyltransferase [Actinomycetota bacterium]
MDASEFYTGLVADLYAPLRGTVTDVAPYAQFINGFGEPALELGCGDGEPLLDLREMGLDVEGLDSSADMLDRCRIEAVMRGVDVELHHASMADFHLPRRFKSIFIAGPTFNLLPDDDVALAGLQRIREHLDDNGGALIPLFIPKPTPESALGEFREKDGDDGATLRFAALNETRDEGARVQTSMLRYERVINEETEALERPWVLHWHTQDGFRTLAAAAGLTVAAVLDSSGKAATPDAEAFVFVLTPG